MAGSFECSILDSIFLVAGSLLLAAGLIKVGVIFFGDGDGVGKCGDFKVVFLGRFDIGGWSLPSRCSWSVSTGWRMVGVGVLVFQPI